MSSATENQKMKLYIVNAPHFDAIAVGDAKTPHLTIITQTVESGQWGIVQGAKSDPGFEESSIGKRLKNEQYHEICEVDSSATEKIVKSLQKIRDSGKIQSGRLRKFKYIITNFWYTIMDDCEIDGKERYLDVVDQLRLAWTEDDLTGQITSSESETERLKQHLQRIQAKRAAYSAE